MNTQELLNDFRKQQSDLFDENGKAYTSISHIAPMTRMLSLINALTDENDRLKKEVTLMRAAEKSMANMLLELKAKTDKSTIGDQFGGE